MKFVDEATIRVAGRQRRSRLRQLPPGKVHSARRPGRRRRRRRRQRLAGRQPRASIRSPISASIAAIAPSSGEGGSGSDCSGTRRRVDLEVPVPVRHAGASRRIPASCSAISRRDGERLLVAAGGQGGRAIRASRAASIVRRAARRPGTPGESRTLRLELTSARRRRPARQAQRRQVDADARRVRRASQGGGLSVHHAAPEPRRGLRRPAAQFRDGGHPRPHRGRGRGRRARHAVSASTWSARGCCCTSWTWRRRRAAIPADDAVADRRRAQALQPGARGAASAGSC